MQRRAVLGLAIALGLGCEKSPLAPPVVSVVPVAPLTASLAITAAPVAVAPPPEAAPSSLPMYLAADIAALFHLDVTDDGLELSVGSNGSGGTHGLYRYVPFANGVPDFGRETSEVSFMSTAGPGVSLVGRRPHLLMVTVAGFRSAPTGSYEDLDADNQWHSRPELAKVEGVTYGVHPWTKDRLLELLGGQYGSRTAEHKPDLPRFRVVQGDDKVAPSLPPALAKRLVSEGFDFVGNLILRTGEVLVLGTLTKGGDYGTLVWTDDVKAPEYFVSHGLDPDETATILGGTSLTSVRLKSGDRVLRLERGHDGSSWVVESTTPKGAMPDVWFGSTLVMTNDSGGSFARTAKSAPWLPIAGIKDGKPVSYVDYVVDREGTVWGIDDDVLVSSRKIDKPVHITAEDLVMGRKKSILRFGSRDTLPTGMMETLTCRSSYVLLDRSPAATAAADFPAIRAALKGHTELAKARFIVSRERDVQFFGAQIDDEEAASRLYSQLKKRFKGVELLCAEPVALRTIKIDLTSGALIP